MDFILRYRKGIVAAIGLALILGKDVFGMDLDDKKADMILDTVISALTATGVIGLSNKT